MLSFHHIPKLWTLKTFTEETVIQHQTDSKEKFSCFNGNVLVFFSRHLNLPEFGRSLLGLSRGVPWQTCLYRLCVLATLIQRGILKRSYNEEVLKLFFLKRNILGLVPESLILNSFGHQTFTFGQYSLQRLSKTLETNIWVDSGQREEITIYVLLHLTVQVL